MVYKKINIPIVKILKNGGVGVIPTDTIYGLVGSALNQKTVARIYRLRKRNPKKPMIILIGQISDLKKFSINISRLTSNFPRKWPPKTSLIFPCPSAKFHYLHRGTRSLAFRLPSSKFLTSKTSNLRAFLEKTGPLVAPSANPEGQPPSKTIREAQKYFGKKVDFYIDTGKISSQPSKVLKFGDKKIIRVPK